MIITEADIREMVNTCLKKVLNEAYPIKDDREQEIRQVAAECLKEMKKFKNSMNRRVNGFPEGWYNADNDRGYNVICSKKLEFDNFPPIILKYVRSLFAEGAYMEDFNEIWVFFDSRGSTVERLFEVLYHETIHYLDVIQNGMPVVDKTKQPDTMDYNIPHCFRQIFYMLWDKFELRAYAYQKTRFGGLNRAMDYYDMLEYYFEQCKKYKEDDPIWDELSDMIWGERKNRRNTKNKFITRTEHLLKRYYNLVMRQFSDEEINRYNAEIEKYRNWFRQPYGNYSY